MRRVVQFALLGIGLCVGGAGNAHADATPPTALPPLTQIDRDAVGYPGSPVVAINASGQAVAAWTGIGALVAFRSASGTWSAPERVSTAGESGTSVRVAIDPAGTSTIAWTETQNLGNESVQVVRHTDAGYVGRQAFVPPAGRASQLILATRDNGDAVLAWRTFVSCDYGCGGFQGTGDIFAATRTGDGAFGPAQQLSDASSTYRSSPAASIGARGDVAVAWEEGTTAALHVRVTQKASSGSFGAALDLASAPVASTVPNVVVAPSGVPTVTWWDRGGMHASRIGPDGSATPAQTLPGAYATPFSLGPAALGVDDAGRVTAAWVANDGLWTESAGPGADLGSAALLDRFASAQGAPPSLAVDSAGGALVAWLDDNAVRAAWRPAGDASFGAAGTIRGGAYAVNPRASLAGAYALIAGQFGDRYDQTNLFATVGDPASVAPPVAPPAAGGSKGGASTVGQQSLADTIAPIFKITSASIGKKSRTQKGKGTAPRALRVVLTSSEAAKVVVTLTRRTAGVRRAKRCVAPPAHKSTRTKPRACTRVVTVGKPLRSEVSVGSTSLVIKNAPPKGTYDIVVTGADAAGNVAAPVTKHLVVR